MSVAIEKLLDMGEKFVFSGRLILAPLYMGLAAALAVYSWKFLVVLFNLTTKITALSEEETMLELLSLVDITMVGNLVIMIMIGGWSMFVRRMSIPNRDERPQWLDHIDTNLLKIKMGMSLIGVSSIQLLKTFINADEAHWDLLLKQISIHGVFVVSTLAMALVYVRTQNHKTNGDNHGENQTTAPAHIHNHPKPEPDGMH